MNTRILFIFLSICFANYTLRAQNVEPSQPEAETSAAPQDERMYTLQVRVIFADTTGIYGTVIKELADMKQVLTQSFRYPAYELVNTIRLSVLGSEEATALVFPDHYLQIIPRGSTKDGSLKVKIELYQIPYDNKEAKTDAFAGEPPAILRYQEREKASKEQRIFPIMASAFALSTRQWEAFGGVPVRVNAARQVRSNTLSTSSIHPPGGTSPIGSQKYLILGIKLEEMIE